MKNSKAKIMKAPGWRLLYLAEIFYSQKTVEHVFKPLIADLQYEYFEAIKTNRIGRARLIRIWYYWAFLYTIFLWSLSPLRKTGSSPVIAALGGAIVGGVFGSYVWALVGAFLGAILSSMDRLEVHGD